MSLVTIEIFLTSIPHWLAMMDDGQFTLYIYVYTLKKFYFGFNWTMKLCTSLLCTQGRAF